MTEAKAACHRQKICILTVIIHVEDIEIKKLHCSFVALFSPSEENYKIRPLMANSLTFDYQATQRFNLWFSVHIFKRCDLLLTLPDKRFWDKEEPFSRIKGFTEVAGV